MVPLAAGALREREMRLHLLALFQIQTSINKPEARPGFAQNASSCGSLLVVDRLLF